MAGGIELPVRVYWEDTDGGGIVYYANYLRFLERARTEWLRARGHSQGELARTGGVLFTVVHLEITYLRPAKLDDQLLVSCEVRPAQLDDELLVSCEVRPEGRASLRFAQRITRAGAALVEASARVACLNADTLKPRRLPQFCLALEPLPPPGG